MIFLTRSRVGAVRAERVADPLLHAPTHQRPLDETAAGRPCKRVAEGAHRLAGGPTS